MAAWASSGATPMAASTWDFATLPEEQAEPDETAMPSRSKAMSSVSALMPGCREASGVRQTLGIPAKDRGIRKFRLKPIAQSADIEALFGSRRGKTGNRRNILGAGPRRSSWPPPMHQRCHGEAVADDQRARPHRPAELVGRNAHQIDAEHAEIDRNLAKACTASVCTSAPWAVRQGHDFAKRLNDARLIVGEHDTDQRLGAGQQLGQRIEIDDALGRNRNDFDRLARRLRRFDHRGMLDGRNQEALNGSALERQIVGLAAAAGENDHGRDDAQCPGDRFAGIVEKLARRAALAMDRGGVAVTSKAASIAALAAGRSGLVALWSR